MSTHRPQVVDPQEFIDILDYAFTGDDVTVDKKRTFIEQLRLSSTVYVAANRAGTSKMTVYRWYEADSRFAAAWEEALQDAADVMETSAYEDALGRDGKRGDPILKMYWLKAHRPKFRDRLAVDVQQIQHDIKAILTELTSQLAAPLPMQTTVQIVPRTSDDKRQLLPPTTSDTSTTS